MRRALTLVGTAVCISSVAACGQATTRTVVQTQTVTQTQTSTDSVTTTRTVTHHAGTLTIRSTVTQTTTHVAGPVSSLGQTSSGGVLTLTGQGTENMGTVNVPSQSLLRWSCPSCSGANFVINNNASDANVVGVNALDQTSGQTVIDAGTYHDFAIETEGGAWTVTITPGP